MKGLTTIGVLFFLSVSFGALNLYTDRPAHQTDKLIAEFEKAHGVTINITREKYPKIKARLVAEGANTSADLVFTKDLIYINELSSMGLFSPLPASVTSLVNSEMSPSGKDWVALSMRARTLVFNPSTIDPNKIVSYADLARPEWKGALCLRTSKSSYNQALLSYLILQYGQTTAEKIVTGWLDNLAQTVFTSDRQILKAIAKGKCEMGIVNSYYLAGTLKANPNFPVDIKFLDQSNSGTHTNGSAIGVLKSSKNKSLATKFVQKLLEKSSQLHISGAHMTYPALIGLRPNTLINKWGTFKGSNINWGKIGSGKADAEKLAKKVGYN